MLILISMVHGTYIWVCFLLTGILTRLEEKEMSNLSTSSQQYILYYSYNAIKQRLTTKDSRLELHYIDIYACVLHRLDLTTPKRFKYDEDH